MEKRVRIVGGWLVSNLLILSGVVKSRLQKILKGEYILSIYFHQPSKKEFERCIEWLKKHNFKFLSVPDMERIIQNDLPFPKGGVLLTVDDGWQTNESNVIAVANAQNVPVTIFVTTAPVEEGTYWWTYVAKAKESGIKCIPVDVLKRWTNEERIIKINELKETIPIERNAMTREQVEQASKSTCITIGAHTHTHPILINCNDEQAYEELEIGKQKLEEWTGNEMRYFAYPNGDYGLREIKMLEGLKYKLAFSTTPSYISPDSLNMKYELPRIMFLEGASFAENICRMLGIWKSLVQFFNKFPFIFKKGHNQQPV